MYILVCVWEGGGGGRAGGDGWVDRWVWVGGASLRASVRVCVQMSLRKQVVRSCITLSPPRQILAAGQVRHFGDEKVKSASASLKSPPYNGLTE